MSDRVFTNQGFENPVAEMSHIITDDSAGYRNEKKYFLSEI